MLECLQRALRVADACMDTAVSVELFVEILNRYVYYFDQQNETVSFLRMQFENCNILITLGYNQILEWTHRTYSFEPSG